MSAIAFDTLKFATKSDITGVERRLDSPDAKIDKLSWMLGILIALAIANFAKQFF